MRRYFLIVVAAALLAACQLPKRVDVIERPGGAFLAQARAEADRCDAETRRRGVEEARHFCEARGRRASLGNKEEIDTDGGCMFEVEFWCSAQ